MARRDGGNPDRFVNREFSWLQFNRRVLEESLNANHPLLERVRFLSISAANLDEFFMVRVAGLAGQVREGITLRSPDGRTPEQQLEQLLREVGRLQEDQQKSLSALMLLLDKEGIESISRGCADQGREDLAGGAFPGAGFPGADAAFDRSGASVPVHSESRLLDGAATAPPQEWRGDDARCCACRWRSSASSACLTARIDVRFIPLEETVGLFIGKLFPGYEVKGSGTFRIIRDSDIEVEEEAEDLVQPVRDGAEAAPPRLGHPHRIRQADAGRAARVRRRRTWRLGRAASACSPGRWRSTRFRRSSPSPRDDLQVQALQSALSRTHPRAWRRLLRRHPREGHHRPPPLRILRRGRAVPAPGGGRPGSRGDQADALPHLQRQPDRARAGRRGRGRQVGDGAGRAQGALRRGSQHPLGARPRARRRAGRVRLHRTEDPREDVAGGAARGRQAAQLRAISAPATTTRSPRASTPTCPSSPPIRRSPATSRRSSISSPATPSRPQEMRLAHLAVHAAQAASSSTSRTKSPMRGRAARRASG